MAPKPKTDAANDCVVCDKPKGDDVETVDCAVCRLWAHLSCAGDMAGKEAYFCPNCSQSLQVPKTRKNAKKPKSDTGTTSGGVELPKEVLDQLELERLERKRKMAQEVLIRMKRMEMEKALAEKQLQLEREMQEKELAVANELRALQLTMEKEFRDKQMAAEKEFLAKQKELKELAKKRKEEIEKAAADPSGGQSSSSATDTPKGVIKKPKFPPLPKIDDSDGADSSEDDDKEEEDPKTPVSTSSKVSDGPGKPVTRLKREQMAARQAISRDLPKFQYALDEASVASFAVPESAEEQRAKKILESTTKRIGERFETGLLWREDERRLPDSYPMARKRLQALERKLDKNPALEQNVCQQIAEYQIGYAHKATYEEPSNAVWYLPQNFVLNPRTPDKIGLVWDAAASVKGEFPEAAAAIKERNYEDDYYDSVDTVEGAIRRVNEVKFIHTKGKFNIRNWISNSREVLDAMGERSLKTSVQFILIQDLWPVKKWLRWINILADAVHFKRCFFGNARWDGIEEIELHIFADAKEKAEGCVAYFRDVVRSEIGVVLMVSRFKMAPLKLLSISRLESELCELPERMSRADILPESGKDPNIWSDSLWVCCPRPRRSLPPNTTQELRVHLLLHDMKVVETIEEVNSRWTVLVRTMACAHRFLSKLKRKTKGLPMKTLRATRAQAKMLKPSTEPSVRAPLQQDEYKRAEVYLLKMVQAESFIDEVKVLTRNKDRPADQWLTMEKSSLLYKQTPMVDEDGLLRMEGRNENAESLPFEARSLTVSDLDNFVDGKNCRSWICIKVEKPIVSSDGTLPERMQTSTGLVERATARLAVLEIGKPTSEAASEPGLRAGECCGCPLPRSPKSTLCCCVRTNTPTIAHTSES